MAILTQASSLFSGQFWVKLKEEIDAISWNLRDARMHGLAGEAKPSVDRAIASSERVLVLVNDRLTAQIQRASEQRLARQVSLPSEKQDFTKTKTWV